MRVVCDSCGATYKIPEDKLKKAVSKATCRKCGHRMLIQKASDFASEASPPRVTSIVDQSKIQASPVTVLETDEDNPWAEEGPTQIQPSPLSPSPVERPPTHIPAPASPQPTPAPKAEIPASPRRPQAQPKPDEPAGNHSGDMRPVFFGCLMATVGTVLLAFNFTDSETVGIIQRVGGVTLCLTGSLIGLFILFTGEHGQRKASVALSIGLALTVGITGGALSYIAHEAGKGFSSGDLSHSRDDDDGDGDGEESNERTAKNDDGDEASVDSGNTQAIDNAREAFMSGAESEDEGEGEVDASAKADSPDTNEKAKTREEKEKARKEKEEKEKARKAREESEKEDEAKSRQDSDSSTAASTGSGTSAPPDSIINTMVKTNSGVKRCYLGHKEREGSFPSESIVLRITLSPNGKVQKVYVSNSAYKDTELDYCLSGRVRSISFPPFSGSNVDYRVVLAL